MDVENSGVIENAVEEVVEQVNEAGQETPDEPTPKQDDTEEQKPKRRGGFQLKIDKLRAENAALREQLEQKPVEAPKDKPKWDDFDDADAYYEALTDWKVDQKLREKEQASKVQEVKAQARTLQETYLDNVASFKKEAPDFEKVVKDFVAEYDDVITDHMQEAILQVGPKLTYYLAKNPDEAVRLSELGVIALNREIGKLEAKLDNPKVVKTTKAPNPINPIGGSSRAGKFDPYGAKSWSQKEYEEWRAQQK